LLWVFGLQKDSQVVRVHLVAVLIDRWIKADQFVLDVDLGSEAETGVNWRLGAHDTCLGVIGWFVHWHDLKEDCQHADEEGGQEGVENRVAQTDFSPAGSGASQELLGFAIPNEILQPTSSTLLLVITFETVLLFSHVFFLF